jgi:thioesterase domain-containing protein
MEDGQVPYTQVIDMAKFYINALQTHQPHGPYQLAGWSFGGLVAFEMARLLQQQGESVSRLALLDAAVPSVPKEEPQEPEDDAQLLFDLLQEEEEISLSLEHLQQLTPDEQWSYVIEQGKQVAFFPPDVNVAQIKRLSHVFKINAEAARCYQPQLYHGQVMLFQAAEKPEDMLREEADYGWKDYATEGVEIVKVPGNHQNMVKSPQVQTLAEQLKLYLKP